MNRDLVLYWNEKAAQMLDFHSNPGSDARRMAIIHIGIHDALNSIKKKYDRYAFYGPLDSGASPEAAVNAAAKKMLLWARDEVGTSNNQIPSTAQIIQWYDSKMIELQNNPKKERGRQIGEDAADGIIQKRKNDGHKDITPISANPPDGTLPGEFKADYYDAPPPPRNKFMTDFAMKVIPFVLNPLDLGQFTQPLVSLVPSSVDLEEVKEKSTLNYITNSLSPAQKSVIEKWGNNTDYLNLRQHIIWNNFTIEIIKKQNPSFNAWDTARLLALIHTAMADGTISMFKDVYTHYRWRPVTAIKSIYNTNWASFLPTPRVPEYPSLFGIAGGATGAILKEVFSNNINISYESIPYTSIDQAVQDNAETKIYCGWNFRDTINPSINQGKAIGEFVYNKAFKKKS
ncbi:hypothetical protein M3O96_12110 [Aquiflexum sp. TKW24L]|uniref:hypothetical protein n=1 Tax=Aquiflexum sp. TKW24L TaxID=2942212 RepID=UPI0020BF4F3A|nr:hypothetical protein [Aquiflexum sp. TKW24L]MCL6259838.1 hypothetical protein [Aquiflexum sp. TKW24L]